MSENPTGTDNTEELIDEYRNADDNRRIEMYLFHREMREWFDAVELEELPHLRAVPFFDLPL